VDPVPDPLLLRKHGNAGNRTWASKIQNPLGSKISNTAGKASSAMLPTYSPVRVVWCITESASVLQAPLRHYFYRTMSSALRRTPNLEDQRSVAQLYPPVPVILL
jgi:hypothetical protein